MATEIKAPTFPESVAEGTVAAWHKKPGDSVERDELIVEIETDKVVLEVVAPEAGTLTDVMAEEGDTVESEQVLGKIGEASGAGSKKESAASDDSDESSDESSDLLDNFTEKFKDKFSGLFGTKAKKADPRELQRIANEEFLRENIDH